MRGDTGPKLLSEPSLLNDGDDGGPEEEVGASGGDGCSPEEEVRGRGGATGEEVEEGDG